MGEVTLIVGKVWNATAEAKKPRPRPTATEWQAAPRCPPARAEATWPVPNQTWPLPNQKRESGKDENQAPPPKAARVGSDAAASVAQRPPAQKTPPPPPSSGSTRDTRDEEIESLRADARETAARIQRMEASMDLMMKQIMALVNSQATSRPVDNEL